jgi:hypothetical protein
LAVALLRGELLRLPVRLRLPAELLRLTVWLRLAVLRCGLAELRLPVRRLPRLRLSEMRLARMLPRRRRVLRGRLRRVLTDGWLLTERRLPRP